MSREVSSSSQAAQAAPGAGHAGAPSPVGSTAEEASSRRRPAAPNTGPAGGSGRAWEIAWLLIKYRMDKGLSQEQLAERVGTSHSQISRIESGRHRTNLDTLSRIAHALDMRMVVGFETTTSGGRTKRDLVAF